MLVFPYLIEKGLTYESRTKIALSAGRKALTYQSRAAIAHRALIDMVILNQERIICLTDLLVVENYSARYSGSAPRLVI